MSSSTPKNTAPAVDPFRTSSDREGGDVSVHNEQEDEDYFKQTWKGKIWDSFDRPPAERKFLFKVDAVVLTFASLGYFLKNLDQTNINSAFVSGMKEELGMYGEELVTAVSIWTVGYVIGQIPSNLLLTRVSPRWVIPSLELGWGIATLGSYAVTNVKSLYALRFLVGLFEAGFYPGIHYILGGLYTPREIGKRSMIFWLAGSLGQMFSGILQSAAYTHLNGINGLSGWRWLFIIDAIITLPIAILGFVFFPTLPTQGEKTWWLTQDEYELARRRMNRVGRQGKTPWTKAKLKKLFTGWHIYLLPMIYVIWNNAYPQPPVAYWLKSFNNQPPPRPGTTFTISQINTLPLPQTAILVVAGLVMAWTSDGLLRGVRAYSIYFNAIGAIIFGAVLINRNLYENVNGTLVLYWFSSITQTAGPLILSWINEICAADTEKRALLVAMANDLAYVVQAVAPNFIWKTTEFPQARKGWLWSIILSALLIVWTALVQYLLRRDRLRAESLPINSSPESIASTTEQYPIDNKAPTDSSSSGKSSPAPRGNEIESGHVLDERADVAISRV